MRIAVVITSDPNVSGLYYRLLESSHLVIFLKSERNLHDIPGADRISLIVLGVDVISSSTFDLHSFSQEWGSRAFILFASEAPEHQTSQTVLELCSALGKTKSSRSFPDAHSRPDASGDLSEKEIETSDSARSPKDKSVVKRTFDRLFGVAKRISTPAIPESSEPQPIISTDEQPDSEKPGPPVEPLRSEIKEAPLRANREIERKQSSSAPAIVPPRIIRPRTQDLTLNGFLLGPFHIIVNEMIIRDWPSRKGKSLLAYLLYNHQKKNFREALMNTFWPHLPHDSARNSLNVAMHGIRRQLKKVGAPHELILFKDQKYFINPVIDIKIDCETFASTWKEAQQLERMHGLAHSVEAYERAAALYKGDFMENELYKESAEDWSCIERENIKERYLFILEKLSKFHSEEGHAETSIALCKTILEYDDCREDIHRRLMQLYVKLGQRNKALYQFHRCEEILRTELEAEPAYATLALFEQIRGGHQAPIL